MRMENEDGKPEAKIAKLAAIVSGSAIAHPPPSVAGFISDLHFPFSFSILILHLLVSPQAPSSAPWPRDGPDPPSGCHQGSFSPRRGVRDPPAPWPSGLGDRSGAWLSARSRSD